MIAGHDRQQIIRTICTVALSSAALLGCATSAPPQAVAPTPDRHARQIVEQVKENPSSVSGGGMIYELFVGQRFSARYDERVKQLTLTDIENNRDCRYDAAGLLEVPENAEPGYSQYCSGLATNTDEFLNSP